MRVLCGCQFWWVNGYFPRFVHPRSFSEKLWSRMLHERDPLLTLISDKLRVREYVAARVGHDYVIPLLWSGCKAEDIPFDSLPRQFVIKTNHGCGYNIIVKDKAQLDQAKVRRQVTEWLGENFGRDTYLGIAWGYSNIKRSILIESFIEENGRVPTDYKCWCFGGRVEFISLHFGRFESHTTLSVDRNFEPGGLSFALPIHGDDYERPAHYREIVRVAERLAERFDFIRVDLYSVGNRIYFGELTPYPGGVAARFEPESVDYVLGAKWK